MEAGHPQRTPGVQLKPNSRIAILLMRERGTKQFKPSINCCCRTKLVLPRLWLMDYSKRKSPSCSLSFALKMNWRSAGARAQGCTAVYGFASTLRASNETPPPGGNIGRRPELRFFGGRCGWGANPTQHEQLEQMGPAANGQGDDPSSSAPPTAHEAWKTSPTPPPLPPPRDSCLLNTEQNIDLSVAVCSQVSLLASSVLLLSCPFWFVALPQVCPLSLPRFDHGGDTLRLLTGTGHCSEDTTV